MRIEGKHDQNILSVKNLNKMSCNLKKYNRIKNNSTRTDIRARIISKL